MFQRIADGSSTSFDLPLDRHFFFNQIVHCNFEVLDFFPSSFPSPSNPLMIRKQVKFGTS